MLAYQIQINQTQLKIIHRALYSYMYYVDKGYEEPLPLSVGHTTLKEEVQALIDMSNSEGPLAPLPGKYLNGWCL